MNPPNFSDVVQSLVSPTRSTFSPIFFFHVSQLILFVDKRHHPIYLSFSILRDPRIWEETTFIIIIAYL